MPNTTGQPTLCLAMIVRDEETNLREWLPAASTFCDEIVIVDTGSTDGTITLLESLPIRLFHQPWAFDFALHRNFGLDRVTSDWILILDADERLDEAGWTSLPPLISVEQNLAYLFQVKNYHTSGDLSSFDLMSSYRLFRNGYGIRYEGAVHNQLAPAIERACIEHSKGTAHADLVIEHFGYALDKQAMRAKQTRIYSMVKQQLALTPDDSYYLYHLLTICLATQQFQEAREAVEHLDIETLRPTSRYRLCINPHK